MSEYLKYLALAFSALLPLINPLGSSIIFLGMVGPASFKVYRSLAFKIALTTLLFLFAIDIAGAAILKLFGVSLPIVQLAGGLVVAAMGWELLNAKTTSSQVDPAALQPDTHSLQEKIFYPFTFPVTAGPGTLVVTITLSAHASKGALSQILFDQLGLLSGFILLCISVFFFYAYAPKITSKISPSTAHGVIRVIAFVVLCIGVQIAWNGLAALTAGHTIIIK
jgi:multiple antibiotic resistance protein